MSIATSFKIYLSKFLKFWTSVLTVFIIYLSSIAGQLETEPFPKTSDTWLRDGGNCGEMFLAAVLLHKKKKVPQSWIIPFQHNVGFL